MEETVNIPLLPYRVKWGRSSESPAWLRITTLKGVEVETGRQIRRLIRT